MNASATRLKQRKNRIRAKVSGTSERPRLSVNIGGTTIFLQLIDDTAGKTLASLHSKKAGISSVNMESAAKMATTFADQIKKAGVSTLVFDRRGRKYHGKVKAIAEALRAADITL
ncbi:50S ribosomal protein L18 [Candidatus Gracilibacteria bacterium CG17_big_fil_post_rev_8_21_14_2_50_48_13]|nr:MAG: 50S ribosomal protein L18 [Candidatus Gracilibacteria bacterium CG17_big_fil_post_rev_8_21_14_2_50_48_13]